MRVVTALFVVASVTAVAARQTSPLAANELTAAAYVDSHNDAALALLTRVVDINSGTENLAGVRAVGDV